MPSYHHREAIMTVQKYKNIEYKQKKSHKLLIQYASLRLCERHFAQRRKAAKTCETVKH